jgi:hypothetical protein
MNNTGNVIEGLILANIKTWHKDTLLKDRNGELRTDLKLSAKEKSEIFLQARVYNSERADARDAIDNKLGEQVFSGKVNYHKE